MMKLNRHKAHKPGAGVKQLLHCTGVPSARRLWHLSLHNRPNAMHLQCLLSAQSFVHLQNVFPPSRLYSMLASPTERFCLKSALDVFMLTIAAFILGSCEII
jgi:hypothetical protein